MLRAARIRLPRVAGCLGCRRLSSVPPTAPLERRDPATDPKKPLRKGTLWEDRELVRQLSILTGSQLILNLGYAQLVPVLPLFAAE